MKKNIIILGAIVGIAAGCASWHRDRSESNTMNEPSGAQRSDSSSMRSTNQLNNSSSESQDIQNQNRQNPDQR